MYFPVSEWFPAFVLTVGVEAPIVAALLRRSAPDLPRLALLFVFANLATHLAVWYVFTDLFEIESWAYVIAAEGWAVAAEALFYAAAIRGLGPGRAIGTALVANAASFAVGRIVGGVWPDAL